MVFELNNTRPPTTSPQPRHAPDPLCRTDMAMTVSVVLVLVIIYVGNWVYPPPTTSHRRW